MFWKFLCYFLLFSILCGTNAESYEGTVLPSGNYKIIVLDRRNTNTEKECCDIFNFVDKKIDTFSHTLKQRTSMDLYLSLFKYKEGINLENLSKCFVNFSSVQTNDSKFKIGMPSNFNSKFYAYIFPLDKQNRLIRSPFEPGMILQNCYNSNNWTGIVNKKKELTLYLFHHSEQVQRIGQLLEEQWCLPEQNAVPSKEAAFLLEAYFNDLEKMLLDQITKKPIIHEVELQKMNIYGEAFNNCRKNYKTNFAEKLAQIGVTEQLLKNICEFLGYDTMKNPIENDIGTEIKKWKIFCKDFTVKTKAKKSVKTDGTNQENDF